MADIGKLPLWGCWPKENKNLRGERGGGGEMVAESIKNPNASNDLHLFKKDFAREVVLVGV